MKSNRKRILITGSGSYLGTSVERWLSRPQFEGGYQVKTIDMRGGGWRQEDFSAYDSVFHVAGIAHADVGKVSGEQRRLYYEVNCNLAVETARKARESGVGQFIYMSSIIVYGEGESPGKKRVITKDTAPSPGNFYGDSKWRAEKKLSRLDSDLFHVAILRPPMIYGRGSRGNYPLLSKLAGKLPVFPDIGNRRSMLYIDNFCEFVRLLLSSGEGGVFFPQNQEYVNPSQMVRLIAAAHHRNVRLCGWLNGAVYLAALCPGRIGRMVNKAFGTLVYDRGMSGLGDGGIEAYQVADLRRSIQETEGKSG